MDKEFDKKKAASRAASMGAKATDKDVIKVQNKMDGMKKGPLKKVWNKVTDIWELYKSPNTPAWAKAASIGGLIYMVSPVDLVPDIFFPLGLIDDAFVIGFVFSQVAVLVNSMKNTKKKEYEEEAKKQELLRELNKPEIKERLLKNVGYNVKKEIHISEMTV